MGIRDSINFHSTFRPEIEYIAEILKLAKDDFEGSRDEIERMTGIPTGEFSGKIEPTIKYANYMGLIEYEGSSKKYKLKLTEIGKIISNEDIYLRENISKIIMNYYITDIELGAPQWCYLFKEFEVDGVFTKRLLQDEANKFFGKSCKLAPLIKTYTETFSSLKLLNENGEQLELNNIDIKEENVYAYAYTLLMSWKRYFQETNEITFNNIVDDIKWGKPLGFNSSKCLDALELLEEYRVVKLNKLLSPMTVIKLKEIDDVKYDLYSMLL